MGREGNLRSSRKEFSSKLYDWDILAWWNSGGCALTLAEPADRCAMLLERLPRFRAEQAEEKGDPGHALNATAALSPSLSHGHGPLLRQDIPDRASA
jgi:streptomycin 6-kinase